MNRSEKFWNKKAQGYAKSPVSDEATYQRKLSETRHFLSPDMHLLEFGCGTGTSAIHHAPFVKQIDAIDISENMLAIGRRRAMEAGIENIDFTRATLEQFRARTASIDAVLGLNVIHLVADRQALLTEVARMLKPGGVFVSSTACLGNSYLRYIKYLVPLAKLLGLMPDLFIMTEEQYTREVKQAGFEIETQWHHGMKGIAVFMIARKAVA